MADRDWRAVQVTAEGWRVVERPPVKFRRAQGMLPLAEPEMGGRLEDLGQHLHVRPESLRLLIAWLVGTLLPRGAFPVLVLQGEQGTTKSTTERRLRDLIDPGTPMVRARPRNEQDLAIAARNAHVLAYDNLSQVQPWLSDALSALATGSGFGTRRLYTDDAEALFQARRPIAMNGIPALATRGDLGDRAIVVELEPVPAAERRPERELDAAWTEARPRLLGALLDAAVQALRDPVRVEDPPRMADFTEWVESAAPALGWARGEFTALYTANRAEAVETELEASPVASGLRGLIADQENWQGEMRELVLKLQHQENLLYDDLPKTPEALSNELTRIAPALRRVGIRVKRRRSNGRRVVTVERQQ